ncbi:MAG: hypothetical protein S0880_03345 [Actinomycetota bacterium]|nr:hypothetical protein [Actinomycetota bacterium]
MTRPPMPERELVVDITGEPGKHVRRLRIDGIASLPLIVSGVA